MQKYLPYGENLLKIGQAGPGIICLKGFFNEGVVHADDTLELRSYWTEVHHTDCTW